MQVRTTYAKTTISKTKDSRPLEAVLKAYDEGQLSVPCVRLRCLGFDQELYKALVKPEAQSLKRKSSESDSDDGDEEFVTSKPKRKRTDRNGANNSQANPTSASARKSEPFRGEAQLLYHEPCERCKLEGRDCFRRPTGSIGSACTSCHSQKAKCSKVQRKESVSVA